MQFLSLDVPHLSFGIKFHCGSNFVGLGIKLQAGELWWMTDLAPHESLPVQEKVYRQFVRVVLGDVSVWYKQHSTENPTGVKVPEGTRILTEEKFEGIKNVFTL